MKPADFRIKWEISQFHTQMGWFCRQKRMPLPPKKEGRQPKDSLKRYPPPTIFARCPVPGFSAPSPSPNSLRPGFIMGRRSGFGRLKRRRSVPGWTGGFPLVFFLKTVYNKFIRSKTGFLIIFGGMIVSDRIEMPSEKKKAES